MKGKYYALVLIFFTSLLALILLINLAGAIKNNVIIATNASHLDSSRNFISDIYQEIKELDNFWSEPINSEEYIRVKFEKLLDNTKDITIYPRTVSGTPRVEVYEKDKTQKIAEFNSIIDNEYNKIYLTNLIGEQDTFDLKVVEGSLEFNHIIDPTSSLMSVNSTYAGKTALFSISITDETALHPNGQYIFSTNNSGEWINYSVFGEGNYWQTDLAINASLPDIGGSSIPSIFYKDSTLYMIAGNNTGLFNGFAWNGTQWLPNSTINASLPDLDAEAAPSVFYKDSSWYLVSGSYNGDFEGFAWNGTQWISNSTISTGLPDLPETEVTPHVVYKDSSLFMLVGTALGTFYGFIWNETEWSPDFSINASIPNLVAHSAPSIFYKDSNWYLLIGQHTTGFYGFIWNETEWSPDFSVNSSLPVIETELSPFVFYKDNSLYLISGGLSGLFYGYNYTSSYNFTSTPSLINTTQVLNSTVGTIVGYKWYFTDNSGEINSTEIYNLITAQDCGTLDSTNTIYTLTQNVSSQGTCFTITQPNITLDCNGYWINYSIGGGEDTYGVYTNQFNTTIKNCNIVDGNFSSGTGSNRYGIYFNGNYNSTLLNNYVYTNNSRAITLDNSANFNNITSNEARSKFGEGLFLVSNYSAFVNNTIYSELSIAIDVSTGSYNNTFIEINATSDKGYGVLLYFSFNNSLTNCTITSNNSHSFAVYYSEFNVIRDSIIETLSPGYQALEISGSTNKTLFENVNFSSVSLDIYSDADSLDNEFVNCFYDIEKESIHDTSRIIRKWYYQAYANSSTGSPLSNVNITAYNSTGQIEFSVNTSEDFSSQELMINGGFEWNNLTGWTVIGDGAGWEVGTNPTAGTSGPQSGSYCVYANGASHSSEFGEGYYIYQDVNLSDYQGYVDSGNLFLNFEGWGVSSEATYDNTSIRVYFLFENQTEISKPLDTIGNISSDDNWWRVNLTNYIIPNQTRYVRVWGNTYEDFYDSGSLDSFSLTVSYPQEISQGYIPRQEITEYVNTGGTRSYYNNYTINATLSGYETDSNILNITETQNKLDDWFTLEENFPDITPPNITFEEPPTPENSSTVYSSNQSIVANISDDNAEGNTSSWIDFDRSLVVYFSMDYYNSTGIFDNSTYNNIATFSGGISGANTLTGARGKGLEFDGNDDYLIGDDSNLPYDNSSFTLSLWINPIEVQHDKGVLSWGTYGNRNLFNIFLYNDSLGERLIGLSSLTEDIPDTFPNTQYTVGEWQHVIFRYNKTHVTTYIDGELKDNPVLVLNISNYGESPFRIGWAVVGDNFNGSLDEVMIFNRSLSETEISALYNSQSNKFNTTLTNLEDGQHNYTVYAIDEAGNYNISGERNFIVNTNLGCGTLDSANTVYTLTQNVSSQGTCFTITQPNITLDCNGYWINYLGIGAENHSGVETTQFNVTIKNCNIYNYTIGVFFNDADNGTIENNNITLYNNKTLSISDYSLTPKASGILIYNSADYNTLINNKVYSHYGSGIYINEAQNNTIISCNSTSHFYPGIKFYSDIYSENKGVNNSIINSYALSNEESGIVMGWYGGNHSIINSTGISNGESYYVYGIHSAYATGNRIINSLGKANFGDGINFIATENGYIYNSTGISENDGNGILITYFSNNNLISNSTGISNIWGGYGIAISTGVDVLSDNNILEDSKAISYNFAGIFLGGNNNTLRRNNITGYLGYFVSNLSNSVISDCIYTFGETYDVEVASYSGPSSNITFLNCSYSTAKEEVDTGNELIRKWYYQAYTNYTNGTEVAGANISAHNTTGDLQFTTLTNSSGLIDKQEITEYINTGGTRSYYSNYTINATLAGYETDSNILNITETQNKLDNVFTIAQVIPGENSCGTLSSSNTVYTLTQNVSSQGTCFTIDAENITLDCNGYWINYSINGTDYGRGIYTNQFNTTIKNCNVIDGNVSNTNTNRQGIYFYQSSNGTIENNTVISNNSQAVHLRLNSQFNNVTNNMFHGFSDIGLDIHTSNNNNVTNNLMIIDSNVDSALVVYQSSDNVFVNNTGIGGGYGIYVVGTTSISSNNNLFINNTAISDVGDAIRLVLGEDNTFVNQIAISSSPGDYAIIMDDVNNTKFIDCTNLSASPTQIYIHTGTSLNNSFINCSYNSEYVREGETELIRKWYYQAYTNYSNGTEVAGANISAYNTTGDLQFTTLTNSSGLIDKQEITEYINTGGTRSYFNNYTINATLSGYETDSNVFNFTTQQNKIDDVFTIAQAIPGENSCGTLSSSNTIYTLTQNVSSQGTCFTIAAENITLDCNNYWINYTGNDVGDYFGIETNQFNATVKNCNIYNFTIGVFFNGADNGTIENNNITLYNNKTLSILDYSLTPRASGILIYNSANYNNIVNNTAYSYYGRGIYINDADNNIIENSNGTSYFNPGIQLFDSSNNTINNSFALSEERVGIWLGYYGDHNSIINSTAISTLEVAILSDYAEFTNIINSLANSSSAGGIYLLGVSNSNIINSTGISLSDDGITITYGSHNNTIFNSTGIGDHIGISIGENTFDPSNNNTVLDSKGIGGVAGIFLGGNNHTTIRNNATGGNEAYHIASLNNSQIIDCVYSYGGLNDVYYSDSLSRNNTFLNCSYVDEYIGGVDGELIRKWYYQAYTNYSNGTEVEGANISAYNTTGQLEFTTLTNSSGLIDKQEIIEYINTGGTRSYYNNYTINATLTGYETDSNSLNITETQNKIDDAFTLNELNKLISVWDTRATSPSSTNSSQVGLPLTSNGIYDFTVYWGDGNSNAITSWNDANVNHTYASEGVYTINITGTIQGWRFNNAGDRLKILEIKNWGPLNLGNNGGYFYNASNLQITATDILNLTGTTTLLSAFRECKNITTVPGMNGWDISNVTTLRETFYGASSFNENISNWNTSNVNSLYHTFNGALLFNQPIGNWNTSKVTQMERTFSSANSFNQHLNSWDTSKVTSMYAMFWNASDFNQDLNLWNTSNVDTMSYLFYMASSFNGSLETWDTSKVTALTSVFLLAPSFNRNISNWNTSKVTTMQSMFLGASDFNQDIGSWDTSNVVNMRAMFHSASSFNQNISNWNTSKVTDMYDLFYTASSFNQNISGWDTSNVGDMSHMFDGASSFNQNLSNWNISNVSAMEDMFYGATLSTENYDSLLIGWSSQLVKNSVQFHAGNSKYSNCSINNATAARAVLTDTYSWTITDGGFNSSYECPFVPGENACGTLDTANTVYTLTQNVSSTGTCFTITQPNITLDCNGYWINYSINGSANTRGVYTTQFNSTIKNCNIYDGNRTSSTGSRYGIYLNGNEYGEIFNNTINTRSSYGIYLNNGANFNNITFNDINTTLTQGVYITTGSSNNLYKYNNLWNFQYAALTIAASSNNNTLEDSNITGWTVGLVLLSSSNNNITNITVTTLRESSALSLSNVTNCTVTNSSFNSGGHYGMQIEKSSNNLFINNSATSINAGEGIIVEESSNNTFINQIATSTGSASIYINASNNTLFKDCVDISGIIYEVYYFALPGSINNTFINCSYDAELVQGAGNELIRKWYYQTYTNYSNGTEVAGANISAYNTTGDLQFTQLTNSSGLIDKQEITEYINTGGTRSYYNNFTINASLTGYETDSNILNITETQNKIDDVFTLTELIAGENACGTLNSANTVYTLTQNVSSEGTCFTITQPNITLDCNGHWINYSIGGGEYERGVDINQFNATVKNCNILDGNLSTISSGETREGIYIDALNCTLFNNSITTNTTTAIFVYDTSNFSNITRNKVFSGNNAILIYSSHNILENNTGNSTATTHWYCTGIGIEGENNLLINNIAGGTGYALNIAGNHNLFINNTAISTQSTAILIQGDNHEFVNQIAEVRGEGAHGMSFGASENNTFRDCINISGVWEDIDLGWDSGSINNTLINCSYESEYIPVSENWLLSKWYYQAYVNYSNGTPASNINITAYNSIGQIEFTELTNSTGQISRQEITDYNATSSGRIYSSNYSINATLSGYETDSNILNITETENKLDDVFTLNELVAGENACGTLDSANTVYTLTQNVSSQGTCFTITQPNITLDCNGHWINYSISGTGYTHATYSNQFNTTIKNCNVVDGNWTSSESSRNGIHFSGSDNGSIFNNTLICKSNYSYAVYIYSSDYNNILNNNLSYYGEYGYALDINTGSSYNNVSYNIMNSTDSSNIHLQVLGQGNSLSYNMLYNGGIHFQGISNNTIISNTTIPGMVIMDSNHNFTIIDSTLEYAVIGWIGNPGEWNFTNVTNTSGGNFEILTGASSRGKLNRMWYFDANVSYSNGTIIEGANISIYDINNNLMYTSLTDSNGDINRTSLLEYSFYNNSLIYEELYSTPHTVNVTKSGYSTNSTIYNLTTLQNVFANIILNELVAGENACGTLDTPNTVYTLTQNVSSQGTCFTIAAENITLDCNGYWINYSINGTDYGRGIYTNQFNSTIKNCNIVDGNWSSLTGTNRQGILLSTSDNSSISNSFINVSNSNSLSLTGDADLNNITNNSFNSFSGAGIFIHSSDYNTIINNTFNSFSAYALGFITLSTHQTVINSTGNSSSGFGFYIENSNYNTFINSTGLSEDYPGVYFGSGSNYNSLINVKASSLNDAGSGFYHSNNSYVENLTSEGLNYGILIRESSHSVFKDCLNISGETYDIYYSTYTPNINNTFLNCSYDTELIQVAGDELIRKWYYQAYTNYSNGTEVAGANISAYNTTGQLQFTSLTNSSGLIDRQEVIEYINTGGTRSYFNNYTINATLSGYETDSNTLNITETENKLDDVFTLNELVPGENACGTLDQTGQTYTLTQNVSSQGTCFTITQPNITLDCNGYWINYSQGEIISWPPYNAILASSTYNVTVKNCNIVIGNLSNNEGYRWGIRYSEVTNGTIENNSITMLSYEDSIYITGVSENTTIKNNKIDSNGSCITLSSNYINVFNNTLACNYSGIYLLEGNNSLVEDNNVTCYAEGAPAAGFQLYKTYDNLFKNNWLYSPNGGTIYSGASNVANNTFINITGISNSGNGLVLGGFNNTMINSTGISNSSNGINVADYNNTLINSIGTSNFSAGILITGENNLLINPIATGNMSGSYGIEFNSGANNTIRDCVNISGYSSDVFVFWYDSSTNNTFVNCSYDTEEIDSVDGELIRKWYYQSYTNYTNGTEVEGANISAYNITGQLEFTTLTNSSGLIDKQEIIEYINTGGTRSYFNNYTINATLSGYETDSNILNITETQNKLDDVFTLNELVPGENACGTLDQAGQTYTLTQNVSSQGTCFTITQPNITLDCNGYWVNYSINGTANTYGIYSFYNENFTIKNCNILDGNWSNQAGTDRNAIFVDEADNSVLFNNFINTSNSNAVYWQGPTSLNISSNRFYSNSSSGLSFQYSSSNIFLFNNTISSLDDYALSISGNNHTLLNNYISGDSRTFYLNGIDNSNIFNNTINASGSFGVYFTGNNNTFSENTITAYTIAIGLYYFNFNNTISKNNVTASGGSGISLYSGGNNNSYNVIIDNTVLAYLGIGVSLSNSSNNALIRNTIFSTDHDAIYIYNSSNNVLRENNVSGDIGYSLSNSENNLFYNCVETFGTNYNIYLEDTSVNNTFINCSYNLSKETIESGNELIRKWYFDANVSYVNQTSIENANLTIYNSSSEFIYSELTNSTGDITRQEITEYVNTGGTRTYQTPHTVNVTKNGYSTNSTTYNLTTLQNVFANIILSETSCACPGLNSNWEINMAQYCNITTNCDLGSGNITLIGEGETRFNATVSTSNLEYPSTGQTIFMQSGGWIKVG